MYASIYRLERILWWQHLPPTKVSTSKSHLQATLVADLFPHIWYITPFCKAKCRPLSVQTQYSQLLAMVLDAVMYGCTTGTDRHAEITSFFFLIAGQGN